MTANWFRNRSWSESIEQAFNERLRRARLKHQYLRIQASTLARSHPEVALRLLSQYFDLPENFDQAQAHVDRATALVALDRVSDAIVSYEAALAREMTFPNILTQAYVDLPYLIATRGVREKYERALQILQVHKARLMFPVDHFRWHAAQALIAADTGKADLAGKHARQALKEAALERSGFRYHPTVGLVTKQYNRLIEKLKSFSAG